MYCQSHISLDCVNGVWAIDCPDCLALQEEVATCSSCGQVCDTENGTCSQCESQLPS